MLDTTIQVKTDRFDGPLSLLLLLIQKEEMDIRNLDLTAITRQYLEYLNKMKELNFDVAGDYLYLASTLLLLKSKECISEEEIKKLGSDATELGIFSQSDLVHRLEELAHFQMMGAKIFSLEKLGHEVFLKPKVDRKSIVNSILMPMDLQKLTQSMTDFLEKNKRKFTIITRDRLSIKEKLAFLKSFLKVGSRCDLEAIINCDGESGVTNTIISFISLLELARLKKVSIFQNEPKGTVYVDVLEDLSDFDVESATGFQEEGEIEQPITVTSQNETGQSEYIQ